MPQMGTQDFEEFGCALEDQQGQPSSASNSVVEPMQQRRRLLHCTPKAPFDFHESVSDGESIIKWNTSDTSNAIIMVDTPVAGYGFGSYSSFTSPEHHVVPIKRRSFVRPTRRRLRFSISASNDSNTS